jgi:ribonucleoside-diphosphate reductase alpha chain
MKVIDAASDIFMQDGKRRSGNMVVLSVAHPDVLDFVTAKKDQTRLPQVNFSLGVSDRFMKAVEGNKRWDLINPRSGKVVMTIKARSIFEVATAMAWEGGDPGLIFLDRINRDNPTPNLGPIEAVNLCGEQPLLPYEACNLGSINLVKFLKEPTDGALRSAQEFCAVQKVRSWQNFVPPRASLKTGILKMVDQRLSLDWDHLAEVIEIAVRFLDDVISVCRYPLPKVDRMVKLNRKIGLGVMGWADALVKMGIPFDSKEATDLAGELMKFISKTAHRASMALGKEKGSFPSFSGSIWEKKSRWMRNATCTSIAPTGSISMVAGVSAGIEPLFALSYYKEVWGGVRLPEINQDLISELEKLDLDNLGEVKKQIIKNGTLEGVKAVPEKLHRVFVTAHEIDPAWHVKMQAAFQKYTDNAVSKTINLPNQATVEDVEKAFVLSWKLGCKGITVYRDKSRKEQVLHLGTEDVEINNKSICPTCKTSLVREEGCLSCPKCGFSACEL